MGAGLVEQVRLPNQSYLFIPEPAPNQRAAQSLLCQAQPSVAVLAEGELANGIILVARVSTLAFGGGIS